MVDFFGGVNICGVFYLFLNASQTCSNQFARCFFYKKIFYKKMSFENPKILRKC